MSEGYRDHTRPGASPASLDSSWEHALKVAAKRQQRRRRSRARAQGVGGGSSVLQPQPRPVSATQRQGAQAESRAKELLQAAGLRWVASNVRCRAGELDLVMLDGQTLVFVEVRARAAEGRHYGGALGTIGRAKRRRLCLAASVFLQQYRRRHGHQPACRFDVLTFDGTSVVWHPRAFDAGEHWR